MPASIFSETELATLHALRRFLFFAHEGKVQRRQADQQTNQVLCLNLVTNAIVTWNTVYMNAAIETTYSGEPAASSSNAVCSPLGTRESRSLD